MLALGRASEAESAIAAVVTADPTYRPGESEARRACASTFTDVRRRLLPEIATARATRPPRPPTTAANGPPPKSSSSVVLSLIDDPDTGGRLSDLRVLTVGFLELSARAAAPPPPPPAPAPKRAPPVAADPARTRRTGAR